MHWIVIPFRGPESAKSRLADAITADRRMAIARAMFQHVLNASVEAAGARNVMVVTPSVTAAGIARRTGATVLRDGGEGLNEALEKARIVLRRNNARSMTVVAADLPLVEARDLTGVLDYARTGGASIARDLKSEGTNVLSIPLGFRFAFLFGDYSYYRHYKQFGQLGSRCLNWRERRLGADLDSPEDLALLHEPGALAKLPGMSAVTHRTVHA